MSTLSNFDSTVNSFYLAFYGRPADPAGLKFWSQQLAASNGELGAITQAFATSEEAQVRFGADSLGERIGEIYQQLFNRTMDADGLAYWTGVVEQGNASLADVSIAILNGARGSDATLSALRQKAADDFTAQVEASGAEYSGYASIEAARILVRAVTPNATEADVAQLVKSAVSFADTATKTPAVVEAIAVNTTLLALFDTTRGKGDPVALAQALADTAKAAAGDPATLESLLRGGGMDKVLKVMPAKATLKDVVDALGTGGLPAAVEVVYPSAPVDVTPTPTPQPEKTFIVGGLGHALTISGTATDNVIVDLTTNTILRNGHNLMGNMNDITSVFAKDYAGKVTVTGKVAEIFVALGDADTNGVSGYGLIDVKSAIFSGEPGARQFVSHEIEALFERVNLVRLMDTLSMEERALFDKLQGFDITKLSVEVDEQAPAQPAISLAEDNGASPDDGITSVAKLLITGLDKDSGTTWQYSIDEGVTWKDGGENNDSGKAELDLSTMQAAGTTLQVRQLDAAGNAGPASKPVTFTIVPDLEGPSLPPLPATFFVHPEGPTAIIYGSATDAVLVDLETNTVTRTGYDPVQHPVAIGMINAVQYVGEVTVVGSAAALSQMAGNFEATGVDAYRIVDIKSHIFTGEPGARTFLPEIARLVDGAASVKVLDVLSMEEQKLFDNLIGFDMATLDAKVDQTTPSMPSVVLDVDSGLWTSSESDKVTNVGTYSVKDQEVGTTVQFSLDGESDWSREKPMAKEGDNTIYVRQVNEAGNVGESTKFAFTLDTINPDRVAFVTDEKSGEVEITGVEDGDVYVEYRIGNDSQWKQANTLNQKGNPVVTLTGEGQVRLEVRQTDQAGNESDIASLSFWLGTAPSDTEQPPSIPPEETPPIPQTEFYSHATYQFASGQDKMTLISSTGSVTGVTDPTKLEMSNYSGNNWLPVESQYLTNGFSMSGNTMQFGAELNAGLYLFRWKAETFTTTNGFLSNGTQLFAGGSAGGFTHDGTSIARVDYAPGDAIRDASYGLNDAIIATGSGAAHIVPGKASNVVVDSGTVTIGYQDFALAGGSLILGFDAGSDKIAIEGSAAAALDRGNKGTIDWGVAGAGAGRVSVGAMDEGIAVMLNLGDTIAVGSKAALAQSAEVLDKYIDVGLAEQDLLIYVVEPGNSDSSALFHYNDSDGSGHIDAADLTYLAMFNGGIADLDDIIVVGTQTQPVP